MIVKNSPQTHQQEVPWFGLFAPPGARLKSVLDLLTPAEEQALKAWVDMQHQDPNHFGAVDVMQWPDWKTAVERMQRDATALGSVSNPEVRGPHLKRPAYEALDGQGVPFERPARVVGELPYAERGTALASATLEVAKRLNMAAQRQIPFGGPVFVAFGLSRQQAKQHAESALLMTRGDNLSLDYCPEYN